MARHYDCDKCPAYCCSYARIIVEDDDIKRLADHFGIGAKEAHKQFTVKGEEKGERVLRHQEDEHFTTICQFIDPETRGCTVYDARPAICREFPGKGRCGYYDFLTFERDAQEDPDWVATTG
ncbi:MAG: YkgJ family cysteine cluster protein [Alphaproteobacteria bacterium]|jgi:Fe-S-cluster containining protein